MLDKKVTFSIIDTLIRRKKAEQELFLCGECGMWPCIYSGNGARKKDIGRNCFRTERYCVSECNFYHEVPEGSYCRLGGKMTENEKLCDEKIFTGH